LGQDQKDFEDMFCRGGYAKVDDKPRRLANGSTNEEDLHEAIQTHLLYMSKEQCSTLPSQTREHVVVTPSADFAAVHVKAMQRAIAMAHKPKFEDDPSALGALQTLRGVESLAKVDAAVAMAAEILPHEPLVIFTTFVDVATLVHAKLQNEHHYKVRYSREILPRPCAHPWWPIFSVAS
jgi:hypothetical protein